MTEEKKTENKPQKGKGKLNIKVGDEVAKGTYANLPIVHNNESEFVFDFVYVEPQRPQGHVVSRVLANPRTAKRLLAGLSKLVKMYEERHGEISTTDTPSPQGTYH